MDLHKDAIEHIQKTAGQSVEPKVIGIPGESTRRVRVWMPGSTSLTEIKVGSAPRKDVAFDVYSIPGLVVDAIGKIASPNAAVYVSPSCIEAVLDDNGERVERIRMDLTATRQFKALLELANAEQIKFVEHIAFMRSLRVLFDADKDQGASLVYATLSALNFRTNVTADSQVKHGDESLGKSVEAQVLTKGSMTALPEEISLSLQVWDEYPFILSITCRIEIDSAAAKLALVPQRRNVNDLMQRSIESLEMCLRDGLDKVGARAEVTAPTAEPTPKWIAAVPVLRGKVG